MVDSVNENKIQENHEKKSKNVNSSFPISDDNEQILSKIVD